MNIPLRQSIIDTLSYMDQFDHPLTSWELYRWLWKYNEQLSYTQFLIDLETIDHIEKKNGYVFLPGRSDIISIREDRIKRIEKKMDIAKKGLQKLRYVPFVKSVFVCNTLSMGLVSEDSDIDVLVVTKKKRIWMARFFANILLKLFGLRTGRHGHADKVCLSFFTTEDSLDFSSLQIDKPDIYLIFWIDQLVPVYDPTHFHKEIRRQNAWIKTYLPHALRPYKLVEKFAVQDTSFSQSFRSFFEKLWGIGYGDKIEAEVEGMQRHKFRFRRIEEDGTNIVINNDMIKLHENDRREQYRDAWNKTRSSYV